MVQRYDIEEMSGNPWESYRCIEENEEGDYVKYDDYMALKAEFMAYKLNVERNN